MRTFLQPDARPFWRRRGLHSSQNTLFKQTHPMLRRPGLHSSQKLDFHANIVRTRRSPRDVCLDINGQWICKLNIRAAPVRGSTVQSMILSNMSVQSITVICLYVNCVLKLSTTGRHWVFTKCVLMKSGTNLSVIRVPKHSTVGTLS